MNLIENFFNKNNNEKVEHSNDDWHEYPDKNKQMKQKIGQREFDENFCFSMLSIIMFTDLIRFHFVFFI